MRWRPFVRSDCYALNRVTRGKWKNLLAQGSLGSHSSHIHTKWMLNRLHFHAIEHNEFSHTRFSFFFSHAILSRHPINAWKYNIVNVHTVDVEMRVRRSRLTVRIQMNANVNAAALRSKTLPLWKCLCLCVCVCQATAKCTACLCIVRSTEDWDMTAAHCSTTCCCDIHN